ncbi:uncharacterized protein LOC121986499 [Zingiber officinale]|uniref:uncharacterized protein LOC121986499 n=1 Tax=Zingiber officinale TaxID=94328 RepID=UPI001C4B4F36|nr:uncharacterized protein LOC121986499 [Zingiber officinale]
MGPGPSPSAAFLQGRPCPSPSLILKNVVGSSHGWLITVGKASVQLLNPITRVHINLPKFPTVDGRNLEAVEAVLSSDPSRGGDYFVAFVFDCPSMEEDFLFLINAEDKKWKMITIGDYDYDYDDIAFHKGKLYAVTRSKEHDEVMVAAYDLIMLNSTPTWAMVALPDFIWVFDVVSYFLCTSSNDLLLTRIMRKKSEHYINKWEVCKVKKVEDYINILDVFKVDTEKGVIIKMNNLGKYTLFLSAASSLCIDTSSLPDLRSNYIYILNDLCEIGYRDNLVYSMEDKTSTSVSLPPLSSRRRRWSALSSPKQLQRPVLVWFALSIALHADPM